MQLDFLFTSNAPMDNLQPGKMTVKTDRCGASHSRHRKAGREDTGSFDTALQSARARHETTAPPSPDSREADATAKTAGNALNNRTASSESEKAPADGGTTQASPSSDANEPAADPTVLSTDDNPSAVDVSMGMEPASDPAAEDTGSQLVSPTFPPSDGDRSLGALAVDAAKSIPASPGASEPNVAVISRQESEQPVVATAEIGNETKVLQGVDPEEVDSQASTAKVQTSATMASSPAAEIESDATMTDAAVKKTAARSEKNRHPNRVEKDAGGSTEKSSTPLSSTSIRGESHGTGRVGGFTSVFSESQSGDSLPEKFGHGAGHYGEAYRSEPQASEKGAERPLWSSSGLKADGGGFQESTGVTSAKSGTESEQKVADMLLASQRAVNGAEEAAAITEADDAHHSRALRAEALGQIVDKAVFRLRNGQSEVRIDLKPDSLGHVKLQIVTENHRVTLRITAESHAAKNLIDSGIGQLKADLQAQGLRVDELEVSVANEFNDFNRHSAFSDDAAQARRLSSTGRPTLQETAPVVNPRPAMENHATAGVDCFV